jgi:hypothetical protein
MVTVAGDVIVLETSVPLGLNTRETFRLVRELTHPGVGLQSLAAVVTIDSPRAFVSTARHTLAVLELAEQVDIARRWPTSSCSR